MTAGVRPSCESAFEAQRLEDPQAAAKAAIERARASLGTLGWIVQDPPRSGHATADAAEAAGNGALADLEQALADLKSNAPAACRRGKWRART